jgi:ABC-type Fe3+ transport system substrate-binding protein
MDQKVILGIAVVVIIAVGGYYLMTKPEPPPIEYALSVDSSPVSGVTVTVDGVVYESPFTTDLEEGGYSVVVPDELTVEGVDYTFTGWADGGTNPEKTVSLSADTVLEAIYEAVVVDEPDDEPPTQVTISGQITDSDSGDPIVGATVSIDGETMTTGTDGSYEVTVDKGTYTVTVSNDGYEDETGLVTETDENEYALDLSLTLIPPTPSTEVTLNVITRHGSDITRQAELLFRETEYWELYNFVDIKWIPVASSLWVDTISRRGDIDLGWGGGPVVFDIIYREGLTAPLDSDDVLDALAQIPDQIGGVSAKRIDDGDVHWVGAAISSFGFTINTQVLELEGVPQPTKWTDLANETYSPVVLMGSVIGTADPTLSTSNTRMFEIILQTHGWEKGWETMTTMGGNAKIYDRSESVRDAAIQGEIGAGTTIDFYGYTAQLQNPGICWYVFPEDGTLVNADPIALLDTSPNPEAAQAFVSWILSPEGQKPWLDPNINRLPINPAVFDTPEGLERSDLKEIYERSQEAIISGFSDDVALSYEFTMMYYFHATLVRDLTLAKFDGDITQAQFKDLVNQLSDPLLFEFTDPATDQTVTFTEEFAISINERLRTDPEYKTEMVDAWIEAAEARYDSVRAQVAALVP